MDMQLHRIILGALIIHPSWEMLDVSASNKTSFPSLNRRIEGLILGLRIANERRRYFVKHLSLAGMKPRISPDIVIVLLQRSQLPWLKCFCREIFSSIGNLTTVSVVLSLFNQLSNRACCSGGHYWTYCPGALSLRPATANQLKIWQP